MPSRPSALTKTSTFSGVTFVVAVRDLVRGAAHHLLAVGAEVRAGGAVIDYEVGHAADGGGGGDDLRRVVRDRPPRRVAAVGGPGDPDAARCGDAGLDQGPYPGLYILLLPAAPAVLFY